MATEKTFTMAGVSTYNKETKMRFTSRHAYIDTLNDNGHENIILTELPNPMTKLDAANFVKNHASFQDATSQAAISDYISKQDGKAPATAKINKNEELADRIASRVIELLVASDALRQEVIDRLMNTTSTDEPETDVDEVEEVM